MTSQSVTSSAWVADQLDPKHLTELDATGRPLLVIDVPRCRVLASLVANRQVPEDREDVVVRGPAALSIGNFFLFIVAICHQTSPQGKPPVEGIIDGSRRVGWDYLVAKLEAETSSDPSWLEVARWSECTPGDLEQLFTDPQFGKRLVGIERRAQLVRDLGLRMREQGWTNIDTLYEMCGARIRSGSPNLIDSLAQFEAYRDPVWKKSLFFLALMRNSGRWQYVDPQEMGPPVDYHEMRGHLRLQTVRVVDADLLSKLQNRTLITEREEIAIRRAVFNAVMIISVMSGVGDPSRLHYLFWNIFRAVCVREQPRCARNEFPPALPDRYKDQLNVDAAVHCPYERICPSAHLLYPILEPITDTDFY